MVTCTMQIPVLHNPQRPLAASLAAPTWGGATLPDLQRPMDFIIIRSALGTFHPCGPRSVPSHIRHAAGC